MSAHPNPLAALPVTVVKGVGDKLAQTLAKLGIYTLQDLLFHLPHRYVDRTRITPIGKLRLNVAAVVQGRVVSSTIQFGRRRSLACTIEDDSGRLMMRFYHFNAAQKNALEEGVLVRSYGEPRMGTTGLEFYHPEYDVVDNANTKPVEETLTPVYGLTEGITQPRIRKLAEQALLELKDHNPTEYLPREVGEMFGVESLSAALKYLHAPPPDACVDQLVAGLHPYQQRLAFEELLAHYLARQESRARAQAEESPIISPANTQRQTFLSQLPFTPTFAQQRVLGDINNDMKEGKPMLRMVQGDVGSGKTLVAALAALDVISAGYQVALVAPTEILAEQHFIAFSQWLEPMGFKVAWLVGKLTAAKRRDTVAAIAAGDVHVVVGTHALFQEDVLFASMGLAIVDEQHRFGVNQRLTLRQKSLDSTIPHQLVMTATPIPRTLAMTAYAELDYSVIDELPPGRTPVNTVLISQKKRPLIIERIKAACEENKQVYWVCTLVEDSETLAAANAEETATLLKESLPNIQIGLVHGRLKAAEKEAVMKAFKAAELQLLVATTVIEVGVDVPNASLMIIENPERLGLAQLHQLRGRVGRGSVASHCVMLYGDKLSLQAKERLGVMRETNDGFEIAEKDLALRGPGELLGTRQTGEMEYRLADLQRDAGMLDDIHRIGDALTLYHPETVVKILDRWFGKKREYMQA